MKSLKPKKHDINDPAVFFLEDCGVPIYLVASFIPPSMRSFAPDGIQWLEDDFEASDVSDLTEPHGSSDSVLRLNAGNPSQAKLSQ